MKNTTFNADRNSNVLPFPRRGPFEVEILREGLAWLVRARSYAWLHGSRDAALADAELIAAGHGVCNHQPHRSIGDDDV
jgi:hypothetical protein